MKKAGENPYEPKNVLVTGGGGFLGGAIVKRLTERGDRVRSFSRGFYPRLERLGVEQIQGDLADAEAVRRACEDMDTIFHTAAKPPPWGLYTAYYRTNVTGTINIINGCLRHKVAGLVYTSTPSVVFDGSHMAGVNESVPYPDTYNAHYPETKAKAERKVVKAARDGLPAVAIRPHQIWGPGDPHFAPRLIARAKKLKRIGDGQNLVDTTYIDNAVDAHVSAAETLSNNPALSGNIYFISDGEPVRAWDMIDAILKAAGLDPVKGSVSHKTAWAAGALLEFLYRTFRIPGEPQMTRFLADAVAKTHWFDISAAKKDLGYIPRVSVQEGLERLGAWLRDEGKTH